MKARVFLDAFAECLVNVAMARRYPYLQDSLRLQAIAGVAARHGMEHAIDTGRMFDRLWADAQNPTPR